MGLNRLKTGVVPTAQDWNQIVDAVNKLMSIKGTGGIRIKNLPNGITIQGSPSGEIVFVKITNNASGGGKYVGKLFRLPNVDISASGNLAATDIGSLPDDDDCLILNCPEIGKSTHDLTGVMGASTVFMGEIRYRNSDGKYVVAINGFVFENEC